MDGVLRPAWKDQLTDAKQDFQQFRIPVPYAAFAVASESPPYYVVSVRAYAGSISSRCESVFVNPPHASWPNQAMVRLGTTDFKRVMKDTTYRPQYDWNHEAANLHQQQLQIDQEVISDRTLPDDFSVYLQIGKMTYRGARPFAEDIVLNRNH
ncbi:hypothetical protein Poly41_60270 [Novipirellula artificiosorum]|uniref:Uncharacterized protein n=2 Tax=Novipirellula artificiosorum TaxID=2528016 RepID=A0A5C6D4G6_9BACT|nr:hypothetical protein Poly41_60270 [Novipirellula artificiosorum]